MSFPVTAAAIAAPVLELVVEVVDCLEVLTQRPRRMGRQLVQGLFSLTQQQFWHRPVRLQRQQVPSSHQTANQRDL